MADYTPLPHMLLGQAAQSNLTWPKALAELIDNSLDAGATRVSISTAKRVIVVEDDGKGCKDLTDMIRLGSHSKHETTNLGMYGVGVKDAWFFCGGCTEPITIESVCNGTRGKLHIDPKVFIDTGRWDGQDPVYDACEASPFTRITLPICRTRKTPDRNVPNSLAWTFTPAMNAGRQIVFATNSKGRKDVLRPVKLPKFTQYVDETFDVDGKKVRITIGIVEDGHVMPRGPFWISYRHRNITGNKCVGVKDFSSMNMGGVIALLDGWKLTKNKDDLTAYKDELEDAVHVRIKPLLEKAAKVTEDIESVALKTELEGMLNRGIGDFKKAKRDSPTRDTGTVHPAMSGRVHRRAAKHQDGNGNVEAATGNGRRKRTGFTIDWYAAENEHTVGVFDPLAKRVMLNLNNQFVTSARDSHNKPALYSTAVAVLVDYCCHHDKLGNRYLYSTGDFGNDFGTILNSIQGGNPHAQDHS